MESAESEGTMAIKSLKVKGTITAILLVALSCFVAVTVASVVFVFLVLQGFFSGHSIEGVLVFVIITLVLCIGLSSIFLPRALSRITDPLSELSRCSKEVARGNFDVHVEYAKEDELGVLIDNFNDMVEELSQMEYLRKDFMSSVSHELKTPLASIQGFADLLCDESLTAEERREYSNILTEETNRLTKLCSNMLRIARLDKGVYVAEPKKYRLDEQIRRVVVLLMERWHAKDLKFDLQLQATEFEGDEEMLHQVWLNLIENAIKFSEEGGRIGIEETLVDSAIVVRITNHGTSIPKEQQKRIFEQFFQGDASHNEQGNGLGLSIVKKMLELSNGEVEVSSDPAQGTTFTVTLKR